MQWLENRTPALAIGKATLRALARHGIDARTPDLSSSEGIIAAFAADPPQSVLIAAGEGGRDILEQWLTHRGIPVVKWCLYRRVAVSGSLVPADTIDAIVGSSTAALRVVANMWFASSRSANVAMLVPSERVAESARDLGFARVVVTDGAGRRSRGRGPRPDRALETATPEELVVSEQEEITDHPPVDDAPEQRVRKKRGFGPVLLALLSLAIVAAAGYVYWRVEGIGGTGGIVSRLGDDIARLEREVGHTRSMALSSADEMQSNLAELTQALAAQGESLDKVQAALSARGSARHVTGPQGVESRGGGVPAPNRKQPSAAGA